MGAVENIEIRNAVARNIRSLADRRGIALNALADFAGVSRSQLFNVLAGASSPSIDWITRVATALGVEPWQLLAGELPRGRRRRVKN